MWGGGWMAETLRFSIRRKKSRKYKLLRRSLITIAASLLGSWVRKMHAGKTELKNTLGQ